MTELKDALGKVVAGHTLSESEAEAAVATLMDGHATPAQIAALLTALRIRGESTDELVGAARAMRSRVVTVPHGLPKVVDTCGTGGDGARTFNISTACAFVVAAADVPVGKHGNRAVSSNVGSADVLEALGVAINLPPEAVARCLREVGLGFMFAPNHHQALRHAAPVRRELGFRTMFNLLGPVTNPAFATHQLIGIFDGARLHQLGEVLMRLGLRRALVVHGPGGLDELGLDGLSSAVLLDGDTLTPLRIDPLGLVEPAPIATLAGGDAAANAAIIRAVLAGTPGPALEVVALNAGAALWVGEVADDLADGVRRARDILARGLAIERLDALVTLTRQLSGA